MERRLSLLFCLLLLAGCLPTGGARLSFRSQPFLLDRPISQDRSLELGTKVLPAENQPAQRVWVRGLTVTVNNTETDLPNPTLLGFCSLDFLYPEWHSEKLGQRQSARLFALSRGNQEFVLPSDFGIPMTSNEPLWLTSRVYNPDGYLPRQQVYVEAVLGLERVRGGRENLKAVQVRTARGSVNDSYPWTVPPGGSAVVTEINDRLGLTKPTRLHGLTASLQRWGERVTLRDATTGADLLTLRTTRERGGELERVESYSDSQGLLLQPDHRYQMVTRYENPRSEPVEGVAFLTFYFHDPDFRWPDR